MPILSWYSKKGSSCREKSSGRYSRFTRGSLLSAGLEQGRTYGVRCYCLCRPEANNPETLARVVALLKTHPTPKLLPLRHQPPSHRPPPHSLPPSAALSPPLDAPLSHSSSSRYPCQ